MCIHSINYTYIVGKVPIAKYKPVETVQIWGKLQNVSKGLLYLSIFAQSCTVSVQLFMEF